MILSLLFNDFEAAQLCLHFGKQDVASVSAQIWLIWTLILLRIDWFGPWFWLILSSSMVDSSLFSTLIADRPFDWIFWLRRRTDLEDFYTKIDRNIVCDVSLKGELQIAGAVFWRNLLTHSISHHRIDNWRVWLILKVCHALWNSQLTQINQEDWNGSGWDAPN